MTPATLVCRRCERELEVTGPEVTCECGASYSGLGGLATGNAPEPDPVRTEKEEQRAGWKLMHTLRPEAKIYDTSQPHQAKITAGVPDWIVFDPELGLVFYDFKREGGSLSEAQQEFRDHSEEAGVTYGYGTVEDLAELLGVPR